MRKDGMTDYFFYLDTYAIIEIALGNPNYEPYKNSLVITSIFNIAELNHALKKERKYDEADNLTDVYAQFLVDVPPEDVKEAMSFRQQHKELSTPDAIGYILAKKHHVKFLTGDEDFRNLPNVEFVKK